MDYLSTGITWMHKVIVTWYGAAIVGGILILLMEQVSRRAGPSDSDVRRAASRYREHYGRQAIDTIGDHMVAAGFAPDRRHRRFLERVFAELSATRVIDEEQSRVIEMPRPE